MSEQKHQFESNRKADVAEPLQLQAPDPPSPYGLFGKLPREIRDPIYQYVFRSSETALARTSKAMHADTKEALIRHAAYHLTIEFARIHYPLITPYRYEYTLKTFDYRQYSTEHQTYYLSHPRPGAFLVNVRFLNVSVVLEMPSPDRSLRYPRISSGVLDLVLWDVVRTMRQPTHCRISLQLRRYRKVLPESFAALKQLRCFQSVEVLLCHAPWETWNRLPGEGPRDWWYPENTEVAVEAVRSYLRPKRAGMAGPAVRIIRRDLFGGT